MKALLDRLPKLLQQWACWLGLGLVILFLTSMLVGWGGYGGALLAIALLLGSVGVFWLFLVFMTALKIREAIFGTITDVRAAAILAISPFLAAALFVALAFPVCWLSSWVQPRCILLFNIIAYDHAVADQALQPPPGRYAILVWPWGGSPDSDLDIVWDPLDRPAMRLQNREGGGNANCRHLISHYYDCGIWS